MFLNVVRRWFDRSFIGTQAHRYIATSRGANTSLHAECLEDRVVPAFYNFVNHDLIDDPDNLLTKEGLRFISDAIGGQGLHPQKGTVTQVVGIVYYDQNGNGQLDVYGSDGIPDTMDDEPGIDGCIMRLYSESNHIPGLQTGIGGDSIHATCPTVLGGLYFLLDRESFDGGTYYVTQDSTPLGGTWAQTGPSSSYYTVVNDGKLTFDFLIDYYVRAFGIVKSQVGYGLNYWASVDGKSVLQAHDEGPSSWRDVLNGLNLRDADGNDFEIPTQASFDDAFQVLRGWLLKANAANMAYMLSAQTAVMALNVRVVHVIDGESQIRSAGFASVNAIIEEADSELALHGHTRGSDPTQAPFRGYQAALKSILEEANTGQRLIYIGLVFDTATGRWVVPI